MQDNLVDDGRVARRPVGGDEPRCARYRVDHRLGVAQAPSRNPVLGGGIRVLCAVRRLDATGTGWLATPDPGANRRASVRAVTEVEFEVLAVRADVLDDVPHHPVGPPVAARMTNLSGLVNAIGWLASGS